MHIRANDKVVVIAGDQKGTVSTVLRAIPGKNKVVVQGVNKVYKHVRPSQKSPQGGRLSKEMPIDASNVLLYDPELGKGVRTSIKTLPNGDKVRVCKKTGKVLGLPIYKAKEASSES